jgi:hypothetical protein
MNKFKMNLIGGGFTHHIECSSALNKNKYVEWVLDKSAPISVHVDDSIFRPIDVTKYNVAWLAESSAIIPHVIESVKQNIDGVLDKYDMFITHDFRLLTISPKFRYVPTNALPWIQNKQIYPKTKMISMIGSSKTLCDGHHYRQQVIQKYSDRIDHYGNGFAGRQLPWTYIDEQGNEESGKLLGLRDYRFSIAMENDNYDVIFCEKITDCFVTGTIPIFWGTSKISELFNADGIIFLDDTFDIEMCTEEFYNSKLDAIHENFNIACNMLSAEDYFYINYIKDYIS